MVNEGCKICNISCKIWETWKILAKLHSVSCDNNCIYITYIIYNIYIYNTLEYIMLPHINAGLLDVISVHQRNTWLFKKTLYQRHFKINFCFNVFISLMFIKRAYWRGDTELSHLGNACQFRWLDSRITLWHT